MDKKILIVDDMMFTRMYVKDILIKHGYTDIVEASSAKEAVIKAVDEKPDLIILDLSLPDCDDLSTLRLLYEVNEKQNVIISSAVNQYVVMDEARSLGVRDYLVKPFTEEQFENSVRPVLEEV